jgi:outer membrane receptor protein involved in Fe transport
MKKIILTFIVLLSNFSFAQQQEEIITFNIIHNPVSSALVYEPIEIRATIVPSSRVAYASLNYRLEGDTAYTVDTYYNELRNFINFTITTEPSFNLQYLNETKQFYGRGGEIAVEYYPVKEIKTLLNFFLLNKRDELDRDELVTQNVTGANLGVFGKYEGLNGALLVHARGPYNRMLTDPDDPLNPKLFRLHGYTLVNLNLGYEIIKEHLTCGIFVFNLFNQIHREFEGTEIYDKNTYEAIANGGEEIGQRFFVFVDGKI